MDWQSVCADPALRDLPYKIELNEYGNIVMSPASNRHGMIQMALGIRISGMTGSGKIIAECAVRTDRRVSGPD